MRFIKFILPVIFITILTWKVYVPLTVPGFFPVHDDTQPSRIFELALALKDGQFPVRIVRDLGYGFGYPIFNFYAPLPYYIGSLPYLLGFDIITSTKIMYAAGIFLSSLFMYMFIRDFFGMWAGMAASVLYTMAPYHAVNIYVRGAVGEYYAYAFLPLLFSGFFRLLQEQSRKKIKDWIRNTRAGMIACILGLTAILLSHNILGMLTTFLVVMLYGLIFLKQLVFRDMDAINLRRVLVSLLLGFGIAAFFILPAFTEKDYTKVSMLTSGGSDFRNHFVFIDQLWNSAWGYAGSAPGRNDGMSFKIGKVHLIAAVLSLSVFLYGIIMHKKNGKHRIILMSFFIAVLILSAVMTLEISLPLWEILPVLSFVQYPWRFLNFTLFAASGMAAYIFLSVSGRKQIILMVFISAVTVLVNTKLFTPSEFTSGNSAQYIDTVSLRYGISRISDEYLPADFVIPRSNTEVRQEIFSVISGLETTVLKDTSVEKQVSVISRQDLQVVSNVAFFPGWHVIVDGKEVQTENHSGRITFWLPGGDHKVGFVFRNTAVRFTANAISLFSVILLLYVLLFTPKLLFGECTRHEEDS